MERAPLNSAVLQQSFSENYQEFFGKCSIVLSTSLSFNWIEDFSKRYKGISIAQKIPFKTYIGFEPTGDQTLEFGDIYQYQPAHGRFEAGSLKRAIFPISEVRDYVNRKLQKLSNGTVRGGKIHCLTELPMAHGYSFPGNFSALLATLLYLMSGSLTEDEVTQWENFPPMELLKNKDSLFSEIFYFAWNINYIFKNGDSTGSGVFASLVSSSYPIITFPAKTIRSRDYGSLKENGFTGLGKVPFWGYRLNDLYSDLDSVPCWPVDMGVVFSGKPCIAERAIQKINYDLNQYEDFKAHFRHIFGDDLEKAPMFPDFYENCVLTDEPTVNKFYDLYGLLSLTMIRQLHCLLLHGYHENEVEKFIGTVGKRYFVSQIMDEVSSYMSEFLLKLNTCLLKKNAFMPVGLFNTNNIQLGGGVGFVTGPQQNRNHLLEAFGELRQSFPNLSVDYLSWLDGYGRGGVSIEQNLDAKRFSSFIDASSVLLCTYSGKLDSKRFVSGHVVEDLAKEYDILCNQLDNSIMIGGKVVSGSDLHSQKATLTLLSVLLNQRNEEVSCRDFPRSSYSQNKNEMQGKIVLPLMKLIRERTKKNLGLSCRGTNTDFVLKLTLQEDQKIGVIKDYQ
jgi:hypothetical protein